MPHKLAGRLDKTKARIIHGYYKQWLHASLPRTVVSLNNGGAVVEIDILDVLAVPSSLAQVKRNRLGVPDISQ